MKKKGESLSRVAMARRLVAAGCPMPLEIEQEQQPDLAIEVSRPQVTIAYDMHAGTEYVFGIRITKFLFCSSATRSQVSRSVAGPGTFSGRS
jgi:hypothetical protein